MDTVHALVSMEDVTVHLATGLNGGCTFAPNHAGSGLAVASIPEGSFISNTGMVGVGDMLVAIDGKSVEGQTHRATLKTLSADEPCSLTFRAERSFYKLHSVAAKMTLRDDGGVLRGYLRVRAEKGVPKMRKWHLRYFVLHTGARHVGGAGAGVGAGAGAGSSPDATPRLLRFHNEQEYRTSGGESARVLFLDTSVLRVSEVASHGSKPAFRFHVESMASDGNCGSTKVYKFEAPSTLECRKWASTIAGVIGQLGYREQVDAAKGALAAGKAAENVATRAAAKQRAAAVPTEVAVELGDDCFAAEDKDEPCTPASSSAERAAWLAELRAAREESAVMAERAMASAAAETALLSPAVRRLLTGAVVSSPASAIAEFQGASDSDGEPELPYASLEDVEPSVGEDEDESLIDEEAQAIEDAVARAMARAGVILGEDATVDTASRDEATLEASTAPLAAGSAVATYAAASSCDAPLDDVVEAAEESEAVSPEPMSPTDARVTASMDAPATPTSPACPATPPQSSSRVMDTPARVAARQVEATAEFATPEPAAFGGAPAAKVVATPDILRALAAEGTFSDDESDGPETPATVAAGAAASPASGAGSAGVGTPGTWASGSTSRSSRFEYEELDLVVKGVAAPEGEGKLILGLKIVGRHDGVVVSAVHRCRRLPAHGKPGTSSPQSPWIYDASIVRSRSSRRAAKAAGSTFSPRCLSFSSPAYQPPADDMTIGDVIVQVNNENVEGCTTKDVARLIRAGSLESGVPIRIRRRRPVASSPCGSEGSLMTPSPCRSHIPVHRSRVGALKLRGDHGENRRPSPLVPKTKATEATTAPSSDPAAPISA